MFWNYIELVVTHIVNILNATELFTSKWNILWYMALPIWYNPYKKVSLLALFPSYCIIAGVSPGKNRVGCEYRIRGVLHPMQKSNHYAQI